MTRILHFLAGVLLIGHGLIHLMGTVTYMKLGVVEGLRYKTTLLGGRLDLGASWIAIFGALWAVAAVGFVIAAVAFLAEWSRWQPVLVGVTLFSLILTALDWNSAFAGVIFNIGILLVIWLEPQFSIRISGKNWKTIRRTN